MLFIIADKNKTVRSDKVLISTGINLSYLNETISLSCSYHQGLEGYQTLGEGLETAQQTVEAIVGDCLSTCRRKKKTGKIPVQSEKNN